MRSFRKENENSDCFAVGKAISATRGSALGTLES